MINWMKRLFNPEEKEPTDPASNRLLKTKPHLEILRNKYSIMLAFGYWFYTLQKGFELGVFPSDDSSATKVKDEMLEDIQIIRKALNLSTSGLKKGLDGIAGEIRAKYPPYCIDLFNLGAVIADFSLKQDPMRDAMYEALKEKMKQTMDIARAREIFRTLERSRKNKRFISRIYGWFLAPATCLKCDIRLFAGALLT